jgi:hypothetical protein
MGLLRVAEQATEQPAAEGMRAEIEFLTRVISSDRLDMRRHVENYIYEECFQRNRALTKGTPRIWFPKIVLQGANFFTDYVLKLRDRGDIPRKWAVEAAGFDWEAGVEQRKRELKDNIDETMMPAAIPFSGATGPQDNNPAVRRAAAPTTARPARAPARPRTRPARAHHQPQRRRDGQGGPRRGDGRDHAASASAPTRSSTSTPTTRVGRVTALEREALAEGQPVKGPLAIIPVNPALRGRRRSRPSGSARACRCCSASAAATARCRQGAVLPPARVRPARRGGDGAALGLPDRGLGELEAARRRARRGGARRRSRRSSSTRATHQVVVHRDGNGATPPSKKSWTPATRTARSSRSRRSPLS